MKITDLGILVDETWARVNYLHINETRLSPDLEVELTRLLDSLTIIYNVLPLSMDGFLQGNISSWLINLKQVSYQAEDLVDDYEILRPKVTLFNFHLKLVFNHKFARKFKTLNQSLAEINLYAIENEVRCDDRIIPPTRIEVDRLIHYPIIGRESDVSKIVNLLLTRSSDEQVVTVVPIVGMRGLGKTALAKLVCQRVMALDLFDVKMWVCVSDKCDELNIMGQMLRSSNATMAGLISLTNKDAIFEQLEKELAGKRFLLVLDDVWGDVSSWWDNFRTRLLKICKHNEIVVLVTTGSKEIASIVQTSSQHRHTPDFLSDDDCWFILKERAFRYFVAYPTLESNLEAIGKGIAKICRGVPLAAKVLGGTLRLNMDEREWLKIIDSLVLEAGNNEENVERILQLCFSYLPSVLKQCFAICSVFPKGFLMIKEDLIQMWMAGRLVDSCDTGNEYFHVLLANSFFQDAESDADGNVIKCKMLNIVLDFALDQFEICHPDSYLYVDYQSIRTSKALPKNKVKCLTTIILNGAPFSWSWDPSSLQMLCLNDVDIQKLPSAVSKLKHFRYLRVSNTKVRPLPKAITKINRLHMLTLSNCSCEHLPLLGYLPFLKFLKISHMKSLKCIGNESYGSKSNQHELILFPALKSLYLSWMESLIKWDSPSHGNGVVIFPLLQNLSIQCCPKLKRFPMRDITTLVKVEIKDCEELRFTFDEHKSFPSVTSLSIVGCSKLFYLQNWLLLNESYEEFKVRRCEWLKFIPHDLGMQSSLTSLEIYCCKGLRLFSEEILGKLTRLRKLSIGAFSEKFDDFRYLNRIKDLRHLEELEIWGSDVFGRKMSALPNQIQHLAGLRSLKIKGFTTMEALPEWLSDLRHLETVSLNYCWDLEYESTAATIQRLPNLSHVYIYGCHDLEEHKSQWMEFSGITKIRIVFQ